MADIAFYRKYRPRTMNDYMGDAIKKTVKSRFADPRKYPQVILLMGSRGTGKTSMARLIAKEYHCQEKTEEGFACGECWACKDIEESLIVEGNPTDGVMELNIATDGGKGAIEEMLEDAMIPPMPPLKYKVVILDECHMATAQAQNALLKIVEEPPEHLVFIFCTTDPEKMITPLKSRCQLTLEVKRPTVDELAQHLLKVCQNEGITTSIEALKIIAKKAGRIPRESLSLLENISIEYANKVTLDNVRHLTGEVSTEYYMGFYRAANSKTGQVEALLNFVNKLRENDVSCRDFINGLIRFTLDCMYIKYGIGLEDYPVEFAKTAKELFGIYNTEELDVILQIIEYAVKLMNSDDNRTELIVITTGIRIGKAKNLSMCITDSNREAEFENNLSSERSKQLRKEDLANSNKVPASNKINEVDDRVLAEVFGAQLTELKGGGDVPNIALDADSDNDDDYSVHREDDMRNVLDFLKDIQEES